MTFIKIEPIKQQEYCVSAEHNPPNMIVLDPGHYTWKCPVCGKETSYTVPMITS